MNCARGKTPRLIAHPSPRFIADRKSLLRGTALVTTLLLGSLMVPSASYAERNCLVPPPSSGGPIIVTDNDDIVCTNTENRSSAAPYYNVIDLDAYGGGHSIQLYNSGALTADSSDFLAGILTEADDGGNRIAIVNIGKVDVSSADVLPFARGIAADTFGGNNEIVIVNHGDVDVVAEGINVQARGINARAGGGNDEIGIENHGDITLRIEADSVGRVYGLYAFAAHENSLIGIENHGDIGITAELTGQEKVYVYGIIASAGGSGSEIAIDNHGGIRLTAEAASGAYSYVGGIVAYTYGNGSKVNVENRGDIDIESVIIAGDDYVRNVTVGIRIFTGDEDGAGGGNDLDIVNHGDVSIRSEADFAVTSGLLVTAIRGNNRIGLVNHGDIGIIAETGGAFTTAIELSGSGGNNDVRIENHGDLVLVSHADGYAEATGIEAVWFGGGNRINIVNHGDIAIAMDNEALSYFPESFIHGIYARATQGGNRINIENHGDIALAARADGGVGTLILAEGLDARVSGNNNDISVANRGRLVVSGEGAQGVYSRGIVVWSFAAGNTIGIENLGDMAVRSEAIQLADARGISIVSYNGANRIGIVNRGDFTVTAESTDQATTLGIIARSDDGNNSIDIENYGNLMLASEAASNISANGIRARAFGGDSQIGIRNHGDISLTAEGTGANTQILASAVYARAYGSDNRIAIDNRGDLTTTAEGTFVVATAISVLAEDDGANPIRIVNRGDIVATAEGMDAFSAGILARNTAPGSQITIDNSGGVFGGSVGIYAYSNTATTIVNSGSISAGSLLAINTDGAGPATIYNTGLITGFVVLDADDKFFNQAGGVFETKLESDFGPGNDLFRNEAGGTVLAATDPSVAEISGFANLERFENRGLITMVDGREGDAFFITGPLDKEIDFAASGDSTLAIDAFLGGPGSEADEFLINGNVSGQTLLQVNNTNWGPGQANAVIPVVDIAGNVKADAFYLTQPIDTGFFNYDLFFRPTGSGIFELRSFLGGGAFLLPQLVTAAQDTWHAGSSTWFDRTADLRVLLNGGGAPIAYDPTSGNATGVASGVATGPTAFTPAVWARGGGNWLDRDGSESVSAFGNDYRYKLDRDLEILDWQMGLDLGKRDLLSPGDILVFGVLGGFVNADLDYDQLARAFDFEGGQIGGYATYLRGGLFVDTLLNVHLLDLETATLGFPGSLDATTVGLRTDTGYRFGSFNGGAFIEPLATLSVLWADIDGFSLGGNTVSFDDEANVRGRLGLRVGTSYPAWTGTTIEPFVIGSLWGNLSGDNQATLTSSGTTFRFEDDLDDVWGEVSAGVNFFNPSAATSVFAKVDVTFGDDVDGIGGKAGMRVSW